MVQKLWHWNYFVIREADLPRASRKDYYGHSTVHFNAWCKACLIKKMHELEEEDKHSINQGQISQARSEAQRRNDAMDLIEPVPGRREGFEPHIRACRLIDPSAKERLKHDAAALPMPNIADLSLSNKTASTSHIPILPVAIGTRMTPEDQKRFDSDLCKLWVALGIPWHGINHPQAHLFFQNRRPDAKLPDRHKLSDAILQREVESARDSMHKAIEGRVAIGMSDGWKNIRRNALLASLLSVDYTYELMVDQDADNPSVDERLEPESQYGELRHIFVLTIPPKTPKINPHCKKKRHLLLAQIYEAKFETDEADEHKVIWYKGKLGTGEVVDALTIQCVIDAGEYLYPYIPRQHLYRLQLTDSPRCEHCGHEPGTITHYLFRCPHYAMLRHEHFASRETDFLRLSFLLHTPSALDLLLDYVKASGRFSDLIR
ncbi:hypothetical protein RSOL_307510, partial [Rhizoctonia solani AG-3 Rhs1AP]